MEDAQIIALYWSRSQEAVAETAEKYGPARRLSFSRGSRRISLCAHPFFSQLPFPIHGQPPRPGAQFCPFSHFFYGQTPPLRVYWLQTV